MASKAQEEVLKTVMTSDTTQFDKGMKKVISAIEDMEKKLSNAFGGKNKNFSEGVSSLSEIDKKIKDINKQLSNVKIDVKGMDKFSKEIISSTDDIEGLIETIQDIEVGLTGESDLEDLIDTFGEASKEVKLLEDALALVDRVDINVDDDIYEIVSKTDDATKAVNELYKELKDLEKIDLNEEEFNKLAKEAEEAGIEVEDLGSVLKGIDGIKIDTGNIERVGKALNDAEGDVDSLESTLRDIDGSGITKVERDVDGLGSKAKGTESDFDGLDTTIKTTGRGSNLPQIEDDLDSIGDKAEEATGLLEEMAGVLAGIAGIGGIGDAIERGASRAELEYDMELSLRNKLERELTDREYKELNKRFSSISNTLGSDDEALDLIRTITLQSNYENDDDFIGKTGYEAEMAANIARTYGLDADEVYRFAVTVGAVWDMDTDKTMANFRELYAKGFQGELDEIAEYTTAWDNTGMSMEHQFQVLMGIAESDVHLPDRLMDAYKIMGEEMLGMPTDIELMSDSQIEELNATGIDAKQWVKWGNGMKKGGKAGEKAWDDMRDSILAIKDPIKRAQLLQGMFGGGFEDTGKFLLESWEESQGVIMDTSGALENTNRAVNDLNSEPWKEFRDNLSEIARIVEKSLEPHLENLNIALSWLINNPEVVEAFTDLAVAFSMLATAIGALSSIKLVSKGLDFLSNGKWGEMLGKFGGALKGLPLKETLATLAPLIGKFALIVGAILAIGGVLWVLYQLKDMLLPLAKNLSILVNVKIIEFLEGLADKLDRLGEVTNRVITWIGEQVSKIPEMMYGLAIGVVEGIEGIIMGALDVIRTFVEGIFLFLYEKLEKFLGFLGIDMPEGVVEFKDKLINAFDELEIGISEPFGRATDWLKEKSKDAKDNVIGFFSELGDGTEEGINKGTEGIRTGTGKWRGLLIDAHNDNLKTWNEKNPEYKLKGEESMYKVTEGIGKGSRSVSSSVGKGVDGALKEMDKYKPSFSTQGSNIMSNVGSGMSKNEGSIIGAMKNALQKARNLLPFSPPKDKSSPLTDIHKNGIGTQIAKGILSGQSEVDTAMRTLLDFNGVGVQYPSLLEELYKSDAILKNEVNRNLRTSVGVTQDVNFELPNQDLYVTLEMGGREWRVHVEDINSELEKIARITR